MGRTCCTDALASQREEIDRLRKIAKLAERVAYASWDASRVDDLRDALGIEATDS